MFANIDAVKNKRVYKFPQFDRSPDAAEIYLSDDWLARVAHPELLQGRRRRSATTIKDSYKLIYQKDVTEDQIKSILELDQNKDFDRLRRHLRLSRSCVGRDRGPAVRRARAMRGGAAGWSSRC